MGLTLVGKLRIIFGCSGKSVVVVWENCCNLGTGQVQEPRGRGTAAVGSRYQMTGIDTPD
jgi:hypothetical protein